MSPTAGYYQLDIGHRREQISKTDPYSDEPAVLLEPIRVIDGDDETKQTNLQPGEGVNDNDVVLMSQLTNAMSSGFYHAHFDGIAMITPNNREKVFYAVGTAGATVTIDGIQITGEVQGSSGTTTAVANANTKASGTTTNSISVDLAYNATSANTTGTSFELTVGDPLYIYLSATGSHRNVEIHVHYKGGVTS